jgi:hypothetical protein
VPRKAAELPRKCDFSSLSSALNVGRSAGYGSQQVFINAKTAVGVPVGALSRTPSSSFRASCRELIPGYGIVPYLFEQHVCQKCNAVSFWTTVNNCFVVTHSYYDVMHHASLAALKILTVSVCRKSSSWWERKQSKYR